MGERSDYFEVFGLPRKLGIDASELEARFHELSRRAHPDYHQTRTPAEQAQSLERSALINRAYRTLRDLASRVEYLVRLEEGRETREGAAVKPKAPTDLLEEVLEVQEALQEAKAGGLTPAVRGRLKTERDRLLERRGQEEERLRALARQWDARAGGADGQAKGLLERMKEALAVRAYLTTVVEDLAEAIGEDTGIHDAHRRH
jgi:Fe-S protein assembly co-chaperone HscB